MSPFAMCADLVGEDALDLLLVHLAEEAARDRDQAALLRGAGGEGVHLGRVVDPDLGHGQVGLLGELADVVVEPLRVGVAGASGPTVARPWPAWPSSATAAATRRRPRSPRWRSRRAARPGCRPGRGRPAGRARPSRSRPSPGWRCWSATNRKTRFSTAHQLLRMEVDGAPAPKLRQPAAAALQKVAERERVAQASSARRGGRGRSRASRPRTKATISSTSGSRERRHASRGPPPGGGPSAEQAVGLLRASAAAAAADAGAPQADDVQAAGAGGVAVGDHEGQAVLDDLRVAADHRQPAHAAELVHARRRRRGRPARRPRRGRPASTLLARIARSPMRLSWATWTYAIRKQSEPTTVAPPGLRRAVDRHALADHVAVADHERRSPAPGRRGPAARRRAPRPRGRGCRRRACV